MADMQKESMLTKEGGKSEKEENKKQDE